MPYVIKRVKHKNPEVQQLLVKLHKQCFPHDVFPDFNIGFWWIAYDGDKPIGFCGMKASSQWVETGYMNRAGVINNYRGKGLQRRMIRVRVAKAKKLGWTTVVTDTTDNPESGNNLFRCGFKMYEPRNPWANDNSIYWRRKL